MPPSGEGELAVDPEPVTLSPRSDPIASRSRCRILCRPVRAMAPRSQRQIGGSDGNPNYGIGSHCRFGRKSKS